MNINFISIKKKIMKNQCLCVFISLILERRIKSDLLRVRDLLGCSGEATMLTTNRKYGSGKGSLTLWGFCFQ
jgi:hypothetical protein